ncbi:MAG: undecaprenyl-diphosphate phosphatase [Christensenellales bacterium]
MNFWILLLLATIQGLTEFLPISSSGHLVLLYNFFGIDNNVKLLSILLHIATLLSVLIYYRKEIIQLIKHPLCPTNRKIIVTTLCTCLVVLILKPIIDKTFSGEYIFAFFLITAVLLCISDYLSEKNQLLSRTTYFKSETMRKIDTTITNIGVSYKQAIIIGLTQGIACIPGISRSGSTIAVGRMCKAEDTTRYSFLISIPIIIASFLMEIFDDNLGTFNINIFALLVAMLICTIIGILCIKLMTNLVNKNKLIYFSYYLIALSTILVVLSFF